MLFFSYVLTSWRNNVWAHLTFFCIFPWFHLVPLPAISSFYLAGRHTAGSMGKQKGLAQDAGSLFLTRCILLGYSFRHVKLSARLLTLWLPSCDSNRQYTAELYCSVNPFFRNTFHWITPLLLLKRLSFFWFEKSRQLQQLQLLDMHGKHLENNITEHSPLKAGELQVFLLQLQWICL